MIVTRFQCPKVEDTEAAGAWLGQRLAPGNIVLVQGEMGSGKTTFIRGLVRGYGVEAVVTSPSFALIHVYGSPERAVVHADPYRLETPDQLGTIGLEEYMDGRAVVVIEWPERLGGLTPRDAITTAIACNKQDVRTIEIALPRPAKSAGPLT